ncbi:tail fiber domain-containing protein [Winogradskyella schleiferi]|uniref:tail fiber domain-containing protein n=1 Tax=Winogradskyella schleiferi TaxID=2686078 RepID=UPI0015BF471F|nr:tail fiber domain-containing protein [Winogradskyella schleiferi]
MDNKMAFLCILLPFLCIAQVGINTTSPNASLDIQSSNQTTPTNTDGILIPKIDDFPVTIPTAAQDGILVYVTGNGAPAKGFYYWDNVSISWIALSGATIQKINDLNDGKSDNDGSDNGSSLFLGINSGAADDGSDNRNIAVGFESLHSNTIGFDNVAIGYQSLFNNIDGFGNEAIGYSTLTNNIDGDGNVAIGRRALQDNSSGSFNAAIGYRALIRNTIGENNTAIGNYAIDNNRDGSLNTGIGYNAMSNMFSGDENVSFGANSLDSNSTGNQNTSIGTESLYDNTSGSGNVALGFQSGSTNTGSNNIFIGNNSGLNSFADNNNLYIENLGGTSPLIYGEFDNDLLRTNGDFEVVKTTNSTLKIKTNDGNSSSISLLEGADYGFEFLYTGSDDKLNLWSRTFSGNEAERMTWLKDGRVGINDNAPNASLDIEASNVATPTSVDGILIPRVNVFPATNPTAAQNGMMVFLNSNNSFYYWKNSTSTWTKVNVERINDLADGKSDNTTSLFLGQNAGLSNTSGTTNTSVGYQSLFSNTSGNSNSAIGYQSLFNNISGTENTALGDSSLLSNTTGDDNTAIGWNSLNSNTTGNGNTATGWSSLSSNRTGRENTAIGISSMFSNTTGHGNTALGYESLYTNSGSGGLNVAIGYQSLYFNQGTWNTALGYQSLYSNTSGGKNTAIGYRSLFSNINLSGNLNVAVGFETLENITTGGRNTAIGANSGPVIGVLNNTTAVGYNAVPLSSNTIRVGNASVAIIGGSANWSTFSDRRLKTNIREDVVGLNFIKKLRPVSYNYNMNAIAHFEKTPDSLRLKDAEQLKAQEIQTGFLAQEVEAAAQAVDFDFHGVVRFGKDGLYGLNYAEFVVPLVKAMQEQQTIIEIQQEELDTLRREIEEIKGLLRQD